jgi:RNA polymerase sigma-70 factor, ECF subfamily
VSPAEFEAEFLPNAASLLAVANRLTGTRSEAEDLVQDTLLKAFRSRQQYRVGTNPRAWLLAILRNTFLNGYRRRNLERKVFDGPDADALASGWVGASSLRAMRDPQAGALHQLLEAPLLSAIDELPPEFKMTVLLADIDCAEHELPDRDSDVPIASRSALAASAIARARPGARLERR